MVNRNGWQPAFDEVEYVKIPVTLIEEVTNDDLLISWEKPITHGCFFASSCKCCSS